MLGIFEMIWSFYKVRNIIRFIQQKLQYLTISSFHISDTISLSIYVLHVDFIMFHLLFIFHFFKLMNNLFHFTVSKLYFIISFFAYQIISLLAHVHLCILHIKWVKDLNVHPVL